MPHVPHVFISSTCFDLKQIREDLDDAITQMGCIPIRSELSSFHIDPDVDTIENCRRAVEREADILVLVIGTRYGSTTKETGKSITNIEYLAAKNKGIPIYVFIDNQMLHILPVYQRNKSGDYSNIVDNPEVFELIAQIRDVDKSWTNGFDKAQDIIKSLREQFAYRLGESLKVFAQLRASDHQWTDNLSIEAFRIAFEQPKAWEHLLFAQSLSDSIAKHQQLRERHRAGLSYGPPPVTEPKEIPSYIQRKIVECDLLVDSLNKLFPTLLFKALGEPGEPGDAQLLVFVGQEMGEIYRQALLWASELRLARNVEGAADLVASFVGFADAIVEPLEKLGVDGIVRLRTALEEGTKEKHARFELILTLDDPNTTEVLRQLDLFKKKLRLL